MNAVSAAGGKKAPVWFMISFNPDSGAYVKVVNKEGKEIMPDYHLYSGPTFSVLRTIDGLRQAGEMQISWGAQENDLTLHKNPQLLYELLRCDNLVDKDMHPIKVSEETLCLRLLINPVKDNELAATFDVAGDDVVSGKFHFLSDVFVLVEGVIHPLKSVGENFSALNFFRISFPKEWVERYLSVFYSCMDNVQLVFDNYTLEYSGEKVAMVPTVVFEKVDADKALYLRLVHTLPGFDADFTRRFDLVYVATLTADGKVLLKRIDHSTGSADLEKLSGLLADNAPTRTAKKEIYQSDDLFIVPEETAGPFLLNSLPLLVNNYRVEGADNLKEYKVKAVKPKLNLSVGSGIDFLEGTASISLDNQDFSLRKFIQQYRKQKYIVLSDGNRAIIDDGYVKRLERIFKTSGKGDGKEVKLSFFDLPEVEDLVNGRVQGEAFAAHRKIYEGFNKLKNEKMSFTKVNATLRGYQKEGVKWIDYLYRNNLGGCLADDMGLGKTLQTISMLVRIYPKESTPSLLIMPRSLLFNWQDELKKFAPQLTYTVYYGSDRNLAEALKSNLVLTTYALVRNDIEQLMKENFHYVILDESQNIKNIQSQSSRAVMLLKSAHRLALSGTPVENNLSEVYALFRFLNPAMFGTFEDFNRTYVGPIVKNDDKNVLDSLRRRIFPFMLRRLKKNVLKELPDRTEQTLYVEMTSEQAAFYEERRSYYYGVIKESIREKGVRKSQFALFQALSELRRIASVPESLTDGKISSPKIETLLNSVVEAVDNGHKVVIFFNFIAGIEIVSDKLDEEKIDYTVMTGSTVDRNSVVKRFQNDPACKVMLMTLKTGGVGLNLTVADTVYIFEPWWNKSAEEQAVNRLHRIGQKAKVLSYSMITHNTIEEKIRQLQEQKSELLDALIGADNTKGKFLSEEDIQFIMG